MYFLHSFNDSQRDNMPSKHKYVKCVECSAVKRADSLPRHWRSHQRQKGSGVSDVGTYDEQARNMLEDESRALQYPSNLPSLEDSELEIEPEDKQVTDLYNWKSKSIPRNHSPLLPRDIRAIIVGKSGAGKTTLLAHLLLEPEMLDYENLMICGKSLNQPQYQVMQHGFNNNLSKQQIRKIFKQHERIRDSFEDVEEFVNQYDRRHKGNIVAEFHDDVKDIPDPNEWDSNNKNLIVFDDIMLGPQSTPEKYYTRGRHTGVDCIYIAQSYFPLPRRTIRENANLFFFFQQDNKNLNHIYQDLCAIDGVSYELFRNFCNGVWREGKHNFITIDTTKSVDDGKYRKNLSGFWKPDLER